MRSRRANRNPDRPDELVQGTGSGAGGEGWRYSGEGPPRVGASSAGARPRSCPSRIHRRPARAPADARVPVPNAAVGDEEHLGLAGRRLADPVTAITADHRRPPVSTMSIFRLPHREQTSRSRHRARRRLRRNAPRVRRDLARSDAGRPCTILHHTMMRTPAAAAPPSVIGGPGSDLTRDVGDPRAAARTPSAAATARAPAAARCGPRRPAARGCAAIAGSGRRGSDLRTLCG